MQIDTTKCPYPSISKALQGLLTAEIEKQKTAVDEAVTINFRDPSYSVDDGGFHPVEIRISKSGRIEYITDFAYVGIPPFADLAKEIDFDFKLGLFQHLGREYPIAEGAELFTIWQNNFISYYRMGVFTITVESS